MTGPAGAGEIRSPSPEIQRQSMNPPDVMVERRANRLQELGQAHAQLAHELRNILVNIGILARRLAESDSLSDEDREAAELILQQECMGEELLGEALDLVSPLEGEREPIEIGSLLEEVGQTLEPAADEHDIDIRIEPGDARALEVTGVRKKLRQAFINLGDNAIDAMAESGGSLTFAAEAGPETVTVSVRDTGPGIPESEVDRLFQPFETTKENGTGLGLPLVRKIVEAHGGHVEAESSSGQGLTVIATLPRAEQEGECDS